MKNLKINHMAVAVSVVLYQAVMMTWYTIFREPWMALQGKVMADFEGSSPAIYAVPFVGSIILYYTMAWLFARLNIDSVVKAVQFSALMWVAFTGIDLITHYLFTLKPIGLALIDSGSSFVCYLVGGALIGAWKKYETTSTPEKEYAKTN
jgi:hypothetical protein